MHSGKTLYPMMGVGAFNIMFWLGFIVGHDIGLSCWGMFLNAFLFGGLGTYGIVKLEGYERGGSRRSEARETSPEKQAPDPARTLAKTPSKLAIQA